MDPFLKAGQSQSFNNYISMFELVTNEPTALEDEFNNYLHEPCPDNPEIEILTYWKNMARNYPNLADVALQLLCLPSGSADVECSFSKLRKLQDPTRSSMSENTFRMQMILYVNQDIEGHFVGF